MSKGSRKRFRESSPEETAKRFRKIPEFDLPEPIIQHIQSFLSSKEAARTTLLFKSWQSAWLTRPNLDFYLPRIKIIRTNDYEISPELLAFAERTLERYENSNLKIDSFRLEMKTPQYDQVTPITMIHRALKLGPTRLTLELDVLDYKFYIPDEVFSFENLLSLTAKGCRINKLNREGVCCSRLQSLSLQFIRMDCPDMISHIISSCPLIEKLSLCNIDVSVVGDFGLQTAISPLHRLTSLVLRHVYFDTLFLADLSSKFPSLKDFTLYINHAHRRDQLLISSPTLEHLHLQVGDSSDIRRRSRIMVRKVKLNIPSIRKLTFECTSIPKLSLKSNSRGWKSCLSVTRRKCLSASWFHKLSYVLNKLRFSRISLSLHVSSRTAFNYEAGEIRGLPTPEIENMDIYHEHLPTQSCCVLFDGLFRICHPKVITQYMPNNALSISVPEAKNIRFLGKTLLETLDANVPNPAVNQYMYGLNDLKEARAQVFDEYFNEWWDEETLHDALSNYNGSYYNPTPEKNRHQKIRFRFYWKQ